MLLFPLLARIENLRRRGQAAQNSRFSETAFWSLLEASGFLFSSPRENREFMEGRAGSSEFSILRDCVFKSTLDASPCENRGFVDRDPARTRTRVRAGVPSAAGLNRAKRGFGAVFVRRTSLKVNYLRVSFGRCLQSVWILKCLLSTIYWGLNLIRQTKHLALANIKMLFIHTKMQKQTDTEQKSQMLP